MDNIWNKIPLEDYEFHMQHASVGQLQLLNSLTKKYLDKLNPKTAMFLGIAGGNGLEHINNKVTKEVIGIDINQAYLNQTAQRFKNQIPKLNLFKIDISSIKAKQITQSDFIWAALILEYVYTETCFEFIHNNIQENGYLVVTIQENNGVTSISQTGVETIKTAGQLFKIVQEVKLLSNAAKFGFDKMPLKKIFYQTGNH